jgi:hypothetical protein
MLVDSRRSTPRDQKGHILVRGRAGEDGGGGYAHDTHPPDW